ncbi:MAG: hypothetical protein ACPGC3_03410, partial [Paracoccaceae bacterium]
PRGTKFDVRPGKTILTNGDPKSVLMPLNFGSLSQSTFTDNVLDPVDLAFGRVYDQVLEAKAKAIRSTQKIMKF